MASAGSGNGMDVEGRAASWMEEEGTKDGGGFVLNTTPSLLFFFKFII